MEADRGFFGGLGRERAFYGAPCAGTDRLIGATGKDTLSGGGGVDTAVFKGGIATYQASYGADGRLTVFRSGSEALLDKTVEKLQFGNTGGR